MVRSVKALFRGSSAPAVAVFVAAALGGAAQAATLAVGPIEQVNLKNSTVVVLGQTYQVGAAAVLKSQAGAAVTLGSLAPNTIVKINGSEAAGGQSTVSSITSLPEMDVPGATRLLVTGVVKSVSSIGQVKIGGLIVDVTATLTSDAQNFTVGGLVQISGTQPNPGGLFLAQNVVSLSSLNSLGIEGGGAATTTGIEGGGVSIKAAGIEGGGKAATALGIEGGGAATTTGIEGGGKVATALGIEGGGAATTMGIEGGGAATTMGIEGGGVSIKAAGIEGGGRK